MWPQALRTACHVKNMCPFAAIGGEIPLEVWLGRKLTEDDFKKLRIFGCKAWHNNLERPKLGHRGEEAVFMGYSENMDAYLL